MFSSFLSGKKQSKRLRRQLKVESLENREVLSATTMTDHEQLVLELGQPGSDGSAG